MVYCNRCGDGISEGFYCIECRPSNVTTSAPSTALILPTANSVYNNNNNTWVAQVNQTPAICASNAVSALHIDHKNSVIDITFAPGRRECPVCLRWFLDEAGYDWHKEGQPFECEKHGLCLSSDNVHYHGMKYEHNRCFVGECTSQYRIETGWTPKQIKEHVKKAHKYPGKAVNRG